MTNANFTRSSVAYQKDGTQVESGAARYEAAEFGKGIMLEEGTVNLLTANQSSLETDLTGLSTDYSSTTTLTRDTSNAWSGSAAMKMVTTAGMGNFQAAVTGLTLSVGDKYTASFYVKGSGSIYATLAEAANTMAGTDSSAITLTNSWQRLIVTHTITDAANTELIVKGTASAAITAYIDGLQIEKKGYATSWQIGGTAREDEKLSIFTEGVFNKGKFSIEFNLTPAFAMASGLYRGIWTCNVDQTNEFGIGIDTGGYVWAYTKYNGDYQSYTDTAPLQAGTTYNYCVTWDGGNINVYRDGLQRNAGPYTECTGSVSTTMSVGDENAGFIIDDFRISNRARTLAEHQSAYNNGQPLPVDNATTCKMNFNGDLQTAMYNDPTASARSALSITRTNGYTYDQSKRLTAVSYGQGEKVGLNFDNSGNITRRAYDVSQIIAAGAYHTLLVKENGSLWSWGYNACGQLGDGTTIDNNTPVPLTSLTDTKTIAAGYCHSLAVKKDGTAWSWGDNTYGQLGDGTTVQQDTPVAITSLADIKAVAAGYSHSAALKLDGTVWAWGRNNYGQLGNGTTIDSSIPVQVLGNVTAIMAGYDHTLALKEDGSLWVWGCNNCGQIGDGTTTSRTAPLQILADVQALAAGESHTLAIKKDGTVWAWGDNTYGQLGDGTTTSKNSPVSITGLSAIKAITAGTCHSAAIDQDGTILVWGSNNYSQLGDGTTAQKNSPVQLSNAANIKAIAAGGSHTLAVKENDTVWAWGRNNYGQLGDTTSVTRPYPEKIIGFTGVKSAGAGYAHTIAWEKDGTIWAFGDNTYGQLGDASTSQRIQPVQAVALTGVIAAAAENNHTLALKEDGSLWAWGYNNYGQLGDGTTTAKNIPIQILTEVKDLAAGVYHSLALKTDGTVWAWGNNNDGQLGDGTTDQRNTPVQVSGLAGVIGLAAGHSHSAALKQDGTVWTWGGNADGQLGDGTTTQRTAPVQITPLSSIKALAAGRNYSLAIKENGTLWSWGNNDYGQLGDGTTMPRTTPVPVINLTLIKAAAAGYYHTLAVKQDGSLYAWGRNNYGQLGDGTTTDGSVPQPITSVAAISNVAAGCYHSAAVTADQTLWTWGGNASGQLGDGTITNESTPGIVNILGSGTLQLMQMLRSTSLDASQSENTDTSEEIHLQTEQTTEVIEVWSAEDLNNTRYNLAASYKQMADINLSGYNNWVPIGTDETPFTGNYDGGNFKILNLTINRPDESFVGLFYYLGNCNDPNASEVKNVILENVNIIGSVFTGGLAGSSCSKITNCNVSGIIIGDVYVGGLFGEIWGEVIDCQFNGNIIGNQYLGGLAGSSFSNITNCQTSGTIVGYSNIGGLIGNSFDGTLTTAIVKCFSSCDISLGADSVNQSVLYIGGLIGSVSNSLVENCYAIGNVITIAGGGDYTYWDIGGFAGVIFNNGNVTNCYSKGEVIGSYNVGGFIGESLGTITSCYYDSETSGQSDTVKGVPKTTAEMKTQSTFINWDFNTMWRIYPTINNGYPYLIWANGLTGINARPYCLHNDLKRRASSLIRRGVDAATGAQLINKQLIQVNGAIPIAFGMTYNSLMLAEGPLGKGWGHQYEASVQEQADTSLKLYWTANRWNLFVLTEDDLYTSADRACRLDQLVKNIDGSYTLTRKDQSQYIFNDSGKLTQIQNGHGQSLNLSYDGSDRLQAVTEPISGQSLTLTYDSDNFIASLTDPLNRQITLTYDSSHNLAGITYPDSKTTSFTYDDLGQVLSETDGEGRQVFLNTYDQLCRVVSQANGLNQASIISYDETSQPGQVVTTVTDRNGKNTIYLHNSNYELEQTTDQLGSNTSCTYDADGNRTSLTDAANNTTTMTYDSRANLITVEDPLGHTTTMTYDDNNNLLTVQDALTHQTSFIYDDNNNLSKITDSNNEETIYVFDSNGLLNTVTTPREGTTIYTYQDGRIDTVEDPTEVTLTYTYDDAGRVTDITDSDNHTTTLGYDDRDNLASVADPLSHTVSFTYDSRGMLLAKTDARNNTTAYVYDDNLNLISLTDALSHITSYQYDPEERLIKIIDARGNVSTIGYDDKGRPIANTNPLGYSARTEYDAVSNITARYDAFNHKIAKISYDELRNPQTIKDALGHTTQNEFDNLNRLIRSTNPLEGITEYSYDDLNRLIQTTEPGALEASQEFDADGNRIALIDPNANALNHTYDLAGRLTEVSSLTGAKQYTYNQLGYLATAVNGRRQTSSYVYDAAGKLSSRTDPDGTITYSYDANRNILTITEGADTITRVYDALNRITSYTDARGNNIQYQYDEVGNLTRITYPDEKEVNYSYDAVNRLTGVTDWADRTIEYSYDANGRLIKTVRPDGSRELRSYDENGRITKIHDVDQDSEYNYEYDALNNITAERSITSQSAINQSKAVMTVTTDNRLDTYNGNTVIYDADGNMTHGPLNGTMQSYTYDSRNRLTAAGTTTYTYDAENNRIGVTENSDTTGYVINPNAPLSQVLMKTDPDDTVTYYVYGLGLIGEETDGVYLSYHFDLRGSTVALTDMDGSVTDSFQYGIYGEMQRKTGSTATPFLFNGKYGIISDSNGLYYMRARYYSPEIMRFTRQDDLIGNITDPLSLNRHAFVKGTPVLGIDPSGHKDIISEETITVDDRYVTLTKHEYTNLGLTVYELPGYGYLFNTDPQMAARGYYERVNDYDALQIKTTYIGQSDISCLRGIDRAAGYNQYVNWLKAGISGASDVIVVAKVAAIIKMGGGLVKVITESGKEIFVPEMNALKNPVGVANTYIAFSDSATSEEGYYEQSKGFFRSIMPILGTYDAVINAVNYKYMYEIDHRQLNSWDRW